jgi:hypothetical protein
MSYKFEGTVKLVNETQTFDSGFKKREIIITSDDDKYPQDVKFEFLKDDVDKLDTFKPGDRAVVDFNLRGNEYNGKYYTNLNGWNIVQGQGEGVIPSIPSIPDAEDDDIPF